MEYNRLSQPGTFRNNLVGKYVTVDIDIFVEDWLARGGYQAAYRRLQGLQKFFPGAKACYRESSSRNLHIIVKTVQALSLLDSLMIRAEFGDDMTRLCADFLRYYRSGNIDEYGRYVSGDLLQIGRCFDEKMKNGKIGRVGNWIPIVDLTAVIPNGYQLSHHKRATLSDFRDEARDRHDPEPTQVTI